MALSFQCPSCQAQYTVADNLAGQTVRCKCGVMVAIQTTAPQPTTAQPAPQRPATSQPARQRPATTQPASKQQAKSPAAASEAGLRVTCSGCQKTRTLPREMAGRKGRCDCGSVIQIPHIRTPATPASAPQVSAPAKPAPAKPAPATPAPSPFAPTQSTGPDTSLLDELTDDDWQADVTLEPVAVAPKPKRSDKDVLNQYTKSSSLTSRRSRASSSDHGDSGGSGAAGWLIWIGLLMFINLLSWLFDWPFWVY